jgi:hypothetical protein
MKIPTRLHGAIDYTVASLLGGLSVFGSLPPPVQRVLGAAGAYHTGYALLTDYEAGLLPCLTMRQHLALDALGGAVLCGTGLLMRRQPSATRALLVAIGLSELTVVALSSATPASGPGQGSSLIKRVLGLDTTSSEGVGYPPLDTPKRAAENVFIVDSLLPGIRGMVLPVRMTVIRLGNGDLLLYSPTRFSHDLRGELEKLGRIRHLVASNVVHWTFLKDWQRACPDVTTWAAPGLRERSQVRRSGVRLNHDLGDTAPPEWGGGIALVMVPGGMGFHEIALFHQPTRTLVLTDLVLNLEAPKVPAMLRPIVRIFGMTAPNGMPPPYLRGVFKLRRQAATQAASRLLDLQPERVIFAHGRWFKDDGTAALRRSLRWLVRRGSPRHVHDRSSIQ